MTLEESVENLDLTSARDVLEQLKTFKQSAAYEIFISDVKTAERFFDQLTEAQPPDLVGVLNRESHLASRNILRKHAETLNVMEELLVTKTQDI